VTCFAERATKKRQLEKKLKKELNIYTAHWHRIKAMDADAKIAVLLTLTMNTADGCELWVYEVVSSDVGTG
jgi:hypothetical protein